MKSLLAIATLMFFAGCEPHFTVHIRNQSSADLLIKTHPSIESLFFFKDAAYDSVVKRKVHEDGQYAVYRIRPAEDFVMYGNIGGGPTLEDMPFDYVALINGNDSMILDSKEKVIQSVKKSSERRNFIIEIAN